jgi:hypothetical protein
MRGWFRAKYIERSEHQRVVAQYVRLVKELRENLELLHPYIRTSIHSFSANRHRLNPAVEQPPVSQEENVVRVDFRQSGLLGGGG